MFLAHSGNPFPMKTTPFLEASRLKHVCCIYKVAYLLPAWSHQPQRGQLKQKCNMSNNSDRVWFLSYRASSPFDVLPNGWVQLELIHYINWPIHQSALETKWQRLWSLLSNWYWKKDVRQWNRSGGLHQPSHKVQIIKLIWILEPRVQQSHHLNSADRGAPSPIPGDRHRHIQSSQTGFLCWCYAAAWTTSAAAAAEEAMTAAAEGRTAWRDRR